MHCCRIVNVIKNKNIKNSLGATWNASHLAVRLCALRRWKRVSHAANHTIPPPPSYEGSPHCPKDKNRSPFHGEKPMMIKYFLGKKPHQISQTILHGRDAIFRVRVKWLIFNMVSQLWANVKYHVPTRFGFSPKASGFYPFGDATDLVRGRR